MKKKNKIAALVLSVCMLGTLSACGSESREQALIYRNQGIDCMETEDYEGALEAFQKALDQSIGKVTDLELDINYYKAETLYRSGDEEGALKTLQAVLDYKEEARAYYLCGVISFAKGDTSTALTDMGKAAELAGKDYELLIGIYQTMESQGYGRDAEKYLNQAIDIKGDKPKDQMQKGRAYFLLGERDKAIEMLQRVVNMEHPEANFYLFQMYQDIRQTEKAREYYDAYLASGLASSAELCTMGRSFMEKGQYELAITTFNQALSMEGIENEQLMRKYEVICYEKLGNFAKAKECAKAYKEDFPEDDSLDKEIIFLETRA